MTVIADIDSRAQADTSEIGSFAIDAVHTKVRKRLPVPNQNLDIDQRCLERQGKRLLLCLGKLFTNIRNHRVVTGKNRPVRMNFPGATVAHVSDLNVLYGVARNLD